MGLLSDFYIATEADALLYDTKPTALSDSDKVSHKGITTLELSTLWAIVQKQEWDVAMLDEFRLILDMDNGERSIYHIPAAFISSLTNLDADTLRRFIVEWAQTEEIECDPSEMYPIVEDIIRLGRRAQDTDKNLYLWNCV